MKQGINDPFDSLLGLPAFFPRQHSHQFALVSNTDVTVIIHFQSPASRPDWQYVETRYLPQHSGRCMRGSKLVLSEPAAAAVLQLERRPCFAARLPKGTPRSRSTRFCCRCPIFSLHYPATRPVNEPGAEQSVIVTIKKDPSAGVGLELVAAPHDHPRCSAAAFSSVIGGPGSNFTRGAVFWLWLLAVARNPSAAAAAREPVAARSCRGCLSALGFEARADTDRRLWCWSAAA